MREGLRRCKNYILVSHHIRGARVWDSAKTMLLCLHHIRVVSAMMRSQAWRCEMVPKVQTSLINMWTVEVFPPSFHCKSPPHTQNLRTKGKNNHNHQISKYDCKPIVQGYWRVHYDYEGEGVSTLIALYFIIMVFGCFRPNYLVSDNLKALGRLCHQLLLSSVPV